MIRDIRLAVTTDGSGDGSATATESVVGRVVAVECSVSGLTAGADSTLSVTGSPGGVAQTILTLTDTVTNGWYQLRALGAGATGASSSEYVHPFVAGFLKVVVAQGGASKSASYVVYVDVDED